MISLFQKARARWRLQHGLSIWYHPGYDARSLAHSFRTLGVINLRAHRLAHTLVRARLLQTKNLYPIPWASLKELTLFHSLSYLESLRNPEVLGIIFGLEPHEVHVDELIKSQRWMVSGTLAAVQHLLHHHEKVAFNLGGGLHHAEPEQGAGFCVYNDTAISIASLRQKGFQKNILIVDLDYHQGNGNLVAFAEDPSVRIYSIHGSVWSHLKVEKDFNFHLSEGIQDETYLKTLKSSLPAVLNQFKPQLIYYLAGNDVLAGDPLGGFKLTLSGLLARDKIVIELAQKSHIPIFISLAGGYSPKAIQGSLNLLYYLLGYQKGIQLNLKENLVEDFSRISRSINPFELQKESDWDLKFSPSDLEGELSTQPKLTRIMGYYSAYGLELAAEKYGLSKKLQEKGYQDFHIFIDPSDPAHQLIRISGHSKQEITKEPMTLIEIVLGEKTLPLPPIERKPPQDQVNESSPQKAHLLKIEWLLLQDPAKEFSLRNPQFPGQKYPGLGVAEEIEEMLKIMAKRLRLDGILIHPSHYHIAVVSKKDFHFLSPQTEGRFLALQETLKNYELLKASQMVEKKQVQDAHGTPFRWESAAQICPLSEASQYYFSHPEYLRQVTEAKKAVLKKGFHVVVETKQFSVPAKARFPNSKS